MKCDVAIIGGGPAGSTVGTLLKAQNPGMEVAIFEGAKFPRDHVGESLLPTTCEVLNELGAWDKIEQAEFPVKLGGLYRWGVTEELFPLAFLRDQAYSDPPRPAKYEGQRAVTAFQVDRSKFDKILLDHSASLGCKVFEETPVTKVERDGDRVLGLELGSDRAGAERVEADYYVDASGGRGILRKALGVGVEAPTSLRNIAIYDYWQNADWGTREGVDGTNIHVMSIEWGWLWFIAMGKNRTSVGLVTSAEYYKKSGLSTEQIYLKAIDAEPLISKLLKRATREGQLKGESDWSYIADRLVGENWMLAGDSCGFADPILSAGVTLAMTGSRKAAYTLTALKEGSLDPAWVKREYERIQKNNIRDHIRFADYWYSVNAKFTDLTEYCREIAKDAGLSLDADEAFRWLGIGGFSGDAGGYESPTAASFRLGTVKNMIELFGGEKRKWQVEKFPILRLRLDGATREVSAAYFQGRIEQQECFRRGTSRLFLKGFYKTAYDILLMDQFAPSVIKKMMGHYRPLYPGRDQMLLMLIVEVLEAMMLGGWIEGANA